MIVLHATVGSYDDSLAWLRNPQSKASTHYLIDRDGAITQLVVDDMAAWHAGRSGWRNRNSKQIQEASIGIELVNTNSGSDPYPAVQVESCRLLCRDKVATHRIVRLDLVRHADIATPKGRKTDPAGFPYAVFVDSVYAVAPAPPAYTAYAVLGLPVYQRPEMTGPLWGYLLPGEHVQIDASGHLLDGRGWVDVRGCIKEPQ